MHLALLTLRLKAVGKGADVAGSACFDDWCRMLEACHPGCGTSAVDQHEASDIMEGKIADEGTVSPCR